MSALRHDLLSVPVYEEDVVIARNTLFPGPMIVYRVIPMVWVRISKLLLPLQQSIHY